MTLRRRLAVLIAIAIALSLMVQGVLGYLSFQHQVYASLDRDLEIYVRRMATEVFHGDGLSANLNSIDAEFEGYTTRVRIVHAGKVIKTWGDFPAGVPLPSLDLVPFNHGRWRVVTFLKKPLPGRDPDFFIQGAILSRELQHSLTNYQQTMLITVVLGTFLAALTALWISRPALRPLDHLLKTTRAVADSGDLTLRVPEDGASELGELSRTFNAMLDRIAAFRQREMEFTRNASHELRTPLTAMKLQLGSYREGYATSEETLTILSEEVERMTRLSEALLLLAREGRTQKVQVDLAFECQQVTEQSGVAYSGPAQLEVCGNPFLLRQAVQNLISNAQTHAPEASIEVCLEDAGECALIQVADTGRGIPAELLSRATEAFFRVPGTRAPGSGLGLSVVEQVALVHGGHIELHPNLPQGLRVRVWIKKEAPAAEKALTSG